MISEYMTSGKEEIISISKEMSIYLKKNIRWETTWIEIKIKYTLR